MEGNAPAYNDAEKGMIDIHAPHPTAAAPAFVSQAPTYPLDEKKADLATTALYQPSKEKKDLAVAQVKPVAKKKKKVSKWILFKIWFNTYRFAA